jgi:hypothetical protein
MRLAIVVCLLASTLPAAALECHSSRGGGSHWSWREVDGRRCWYPGRARVPKAELRWRAEVTQAVPPPTPPPRPAPTEPAIRVLKVRVLSEPTFAERWQARIGRQP